MPNTRHKGQRYVNEAMTLYREAGFVTWKPGNKAVWIPDGKGGRRAVSQSQDIFEVFDFIATCENAIYWVQVKAQESHASEARALIQQVPMPENTRRVVLCRVARRPRHFVAWVSWDNQAAPRYTWTRLYLNGTLEFCDRPTWER